MTTKEYIKAHLNDDIRRLALSASPDSKIDMAFALDQIAGWQTAKKKIPTWAAVEGIVYPPRLSMEQCSSEQTARYKAELARRLTKTSKTSGDGISIVDMTGGFGVDFSFMATVFDHATYIEHNNILCDIARENFERLSLSHARVVNVDSTSYLETMPRSTMIFADPARRDSNGGRTYAIADCTPDILGTMELMLDKADFILVKLSPMLDIRQAIKEIENCAQAFVVETHIVATAGECKELLLVIRKRNGSDDEKKRLTVCANDSEVFECGGQTTCEPQPITNRHDGMPADGSHGIEKWLYVPNAAIMKAGCFDELGTRFGIRQIDRNSHLFTSKHRIDGFPGRRFEVKQVSTMNKKELRQATDGIIKANVAVRNFPMRAEQLQRKLKLKDGGDTYIFGTTVEGLHIIIIGNRM